jgi:hypothetical protein
MKQEAEERVCILIVDDEKVMQESCARILLKSFGPEEFDPCNSQCHEISCETLKKFFLRKGDTCISKNF